MLPEFEAAVIGHRARAAEDVSADVPGRLPRQGGGRKERGVHAGREGGERAGAAGARRRVRERRSGSRAAALDDLRAEVESNLKLELQAKARKPRQGSGLRRAARAGEVPAAEVAARRRGAADDGADGARPAAAGHEGRGHQADAGHVRRRRPSIAWRSASSSASWCGAHNLAAKPEQVRALVAEAAQTYEQPDAVVRWHYEKPERLNEFAVARGRTQHRRLGAGAREGGGQADDVRGGHGARARLAARRGDRNRPVCQRHGGLRPADRLSDSLDARARRVPSSRYGRSRAPGKRRLDVKRHRH